MILSRRAPCGSVQQLVHWSHAVTSGWTEQTSLTYMLSLRMLAWLPLGFTNFLMYHVCMRLAHHMMPETVPLLKLPPRKAHRPLLLVLRSGCASCNRPSCCKHEKLVMVPNGTRACPCLGKKACLFNANSCSYSQLNFRAVGPACLRYGLEALWILIP